MGNPYWWNEPYVMLLKIHINSEKRRCSDIAFSGLRKSQPKMAANRTEKFSVFKVVNTLNYDVLKLKNGWNGHINIFCQHNYLEILHFTWLSMIYWLLFPSPQLFLGFQSPKFQEDLQTWSLLTILIFLMKPVKCFLRSSFLKHNFFVVYHV